MDPAFSILLVGLVVALAAWTAKTWWHRIPVAQPVVVPAPFDDEPHTLTLVGPDGRPNPLSYEKFPNYPAALTRQRELARMGQNSVVFHVESGQVRIDLAAWLGPYARITL